MSKYAHMVVCSNRDSRVSDGSWYFFKDEFDHICCGQYLL